MAKKNYGFNKKPSEAYNGLMASFFNYLECLTSNQERGAFLASLDLTAKEAFNMKNSKKPVSLERQDKIYKVLNKLKR